jgi:GNAT superfamily N-acetyltransferase
MTATIRRPDPADLADLAALTGFFDGLSTRTRVQRFFAPVRPTPAMVRLACGLARRTGHAGQDGHTGQDSQAAQADVLVATHGGVIVGHAMAADGAPVPLDGPVTEIGVVVADAWQGQGVGAALVRALVSRAQARGVTAIRMDVLPGNRDVLAMIDGHWTAARTHRSADCVTLQVALPPAAQARPHPAAARARRGAGSRQLASRR